MRKFKAFTLIELIVVMAILSILMLGIMNLMKPIRACFLDSTLYESQRNAQNGIVRYLTESTRYATNLGIYNTAVSGSPNTLANAVIAFKAKSGVTDDTKINIITIDNKSNFMFNNKDYKGRLLRSRVASTPLNIATNTNYDDNYCTINGLNKCRVALGTSYYGGYTYSINVVPNSNGLDISVSSITSTNLNKTGGEVDGVATQKHVMTNGEVNCLNLQAPVNGTFDITYAGSGTVTNNTKTYIIFTLPD